MAVIDHQSELARAGANVEGPLGQAWFLCRRYPLGAVGAVIVALFVFTAACESQSGDDGWIELFNGENMDDWTVKVRGHLAGENFANTFRVEDGLLTVGYDEYDSDYNDRFGHIFHKTPFSHYRLLVEYRFVGEQAQNAPGWATRNSGVILHSQDPYTMPPGQDFPISIEVQFLGRLQKHAGFGFS